MYFSFLRHHDVIDYYVTEYNWDFQPGIVTNFKLFNEIDRPPTYEWDSSRVDDALQLAS